MIGKQYEYEYEYEYEFNASIYSTEYIMAY